MAQDLGMEVAEGVETEADRTILLGSRRAARPGYHFARPMSDLSLMAWLGERRINQSGARLLAAERGGLGRSVSISAALRFQRHRWRF